MQTIHFTLLKSDEIHAFALRVLLLVEVLISEDGFLKSIYTRLQQRTSDLTAAYGAERGSKFTALLTEADAWRDRLFLGLRTYISAFLYHPEESFVQAGRTLETLIEQYGATLYNYSYAVQTSQLNALLTALTSTTAQAAVTTINATIWVDQLRDAQQAFEKLYQEKVATEAGPSAPLVSDARNEIVQYLTQMLPYIGANVALDADKFKPVAEKIDAVIAEVMRVARSRKSKQTSAKKKATPTEG